MITNAEAGEPALHVVEAVLLACIHGRQKVVPVMDRDLDPSLIAVPDAPSGDQRLVGGLDFADGFPLTMRRNRFCELPKSVERLSVTRVARQDAVRVQQRIEHDVEADPLRRAALEHRFRNDFVPDGVVLQKAEKLVACSHRH